MSIIRDTVKGLSDEQLRIVFVEYEQYELTGVLSHNGLIRLLAEKTVAQHGSSSTLLWFDMIAHEAWRELYVRRCGES